MKKFISYFLMATVICLWGCQDKLENEFKDPSVYSPTSEVVSGMFTRMMANGRTGFMLNDYADFWYQADGGYISHIELYGRYYRTAYTYLKDRADPKVGFGINGIQGHFNSLYTGFKEMPLLKIELAALSETEQKDLAIYDVLTNMVYDMRATMMVDIFNDIPYSDALRGVEGLFFPKYDKGGDVYTTALANIKTATDKLSGLYSAMTPEGKKKFEVQDIIFQGDINKWISYADAMRLRLAVRISGVKTDEAKTIIADVLSRGNLPTADIEMIPQDWFRSNQSTGDGGTFRRGMRERDYAGFVPPLLTEIMSRDGKDEYTQGVDDPRMPVLFTGAKGSDINAGVRIYRPIDFDCVQGQKNLDELGHTYVTSYNYYVTPSLYFNNYYMCYNLATFMWNHEPWYIFSVAELELLKAEIAEKGLGNTGSSASQHIYNAVVSSTDYWYRHNEACVWPSVVTISADESAYLKPAKPSAAIIQTFANVIKTNYEQAAGIEGKMEILMQQKFVHLNVHNSLELWTELRRTRHPKLNPLIYDPSTIINTCVERVTYPGSEAERNFENYATVVEQDNFTSPIFWAGQNPVSYYKY